MASLEKVTFFLALMVKVNFSCLKQNMFNNLNLHVQCVIAKAKPRQARLL